MTAVSGDGLTTYGVHLVSDETNAARLRAQAVAAQRLTVDVDVADVRDERSLFDELARALAIPHPVSGWDALLGLLAELDEWMPHEAGYLLVVDGLDALRQSANDAFGNLVSILPNVCDRWRSIATPFAVVLLGSLSTLTDARRLLDSANADLANAARTWGVNTGPTTINGPERAT